MPEGSAGPSDRDRRHLTYDYWRYEGRDYSGFYEVMFARMRPVPPVLELGSGLGFFLECCRRHGVEAIGLESSREGVEATTRRRLPVVRADFTLPFPFKDGAFGSVFAHHVIEHVSQEQERFVLGEVRRVLRDGGFLFVVSPNAYAPGARDDPDHINLFTPHELGRELRAAGYRRVSLGTNYWRAALRLGSLGRILAGALWKIAPVDRFAGTASAMAWK